MNYAIEWTGNNAIATFTGNVGFKEIDTANGMLYGDARFEKMEYQIFNFENAEKVTLTDKDLEMIAALDKNSSIWNRQIKVAVIFNKQELIDLFEIYKTAMMETDWEIEAFKSLEEAEKWCKKQS